MERAGGNLASDATHSTHRACGLANQKAGTAGIRCREMSNVHGVLVSSKEGSTMPPRKFRILSAVTAGSLALTAVAITASSGTSPRAEHAALAAQTESFPPVSLDNCPTLHAGYPTGGCVAQLQSELNSIQGNHLAVDGTFGSVGSQTYKAVIAFRSCLKTCPLFRGEPQ
jgi:hypothetical protein